MKEKLLKRITMNPKISFGKPTIRNMRYPVEIMLDLLAAGMTTEEILEDYPDLEKEDLQACVLFANEAIRVKSIHKVAV
ncbi:MAG: DUF433 domain-containing protein [Tunicatimonas sp.]